ncbi:NAD(P)-dependent oxidoreductase [uncultured Ferrovibrio sp.]|uniref:NAD(P)-dependent oxidoreductase n=1 Tax=uncultured Ferrovibrio sp. TaxID=1576913 RepID=UPI00260E1EFB|nr:NAD(P)-dependent oxidoreductase [uncultured Ferrovibrio sp.]
MQNGHPPREPILFIGAGKMGGPIIARLLKAGVTVRFFDISPAVVAQISAMGADIAPDPSADPSGHKYIFLCLPAPSNVARLFDGWRVTLAPGTVVVDFTTVSPTMARHLAERAAERKAVYLESPLSGGERGAITGDMVAIVSGDRTAYDSVQPYLEIIARTVRYAGATGQASQIKALNQIAYIGYNLIFAQIIRLGEELGIERSLLLDVFQNGAPAHPLINDRMPKILSSNFSEGFSLVRALKDLECLEVPPDLQSQHLFLADHFRSLVKAAVADGKGERDILGLFLEPKDLAGR